MKFYHILSPGSRDKTAILWNLESGRSFDDAFIFSILKSAVAIGIIAFVSIV
jgi:hypothetical protein